MSDKKKPVAAEIETPEGKSAYDPSAKTMKVRVNALLCGEWGTFYEGVHEMDAALAARFVKEKLAVEVKEEK